MRKITAIILTMVLVFATATSAFANEGIAKNSTDNKTTSELIKKSSAPVGVKFGNDTTVEGNYEIEGVAVSASVSFISVAIGLSGISAYITAAVTTAIGTGASHIYWVKKIAYGEDSKYYYVRTKVRMYADPAHTNPVSEWKTVYHKKSKSSGAAMEDELI